MRFRGWGRQLTAHLRRVLVSGLVLAGYLASSIGLPLPAPRIIKDLSRPFPCQHRRCGCLDADQCWKQCCCFSPEQRQRWARAHGIEAPLCDHAEADDGDRSPPCCSAPDTPASSYCHDAEPGAAGTASACPTCGQPSLPLEKVEPSTVTWVIGALARRCAGLASDWLSAHPAVPPSCESGWHPEYPLVGILPPWKATLRLLSKPPPEPPPRGSAAN
jgi:hypothetical protein